jgi:outer membrane receptor protein involved in Fe transport
MPGAKSLNLDIGIRRSDYSAFGSTSKGQLKIEYKPIDDLMLRGTYAQVLRVPTLADLYAAPVNSSSTFTDPCFGVTAAQVAASPNLGLACRGAALDGSFSFNGTSQITGLITSNPNLKPETGNVITYGFVLQAPYVENLSTSVDFWRYDIKNLITTLDPNYSIGQCIATGAASFCNLLTRYAAGTNQGQILVFQQPTINLGELKTNGVDLGIKYAYGTQRFGKFRFGVDATYIQKYESISLPGSTPEQVAGTYGLQFGNYARWRGTARANWSYSDFDAMVQARYIGKLVVHNPAVVCSATFCPDFTPNNVDLPVPAQVYLDATVGYTYNVDTKVQFGMQNITDKQPPTLYGNNVTNVNTDVATYDLMGRRFFLSVTRKF